MVLCSTYQSEITTIDKNNVCSCTDLKSQGDCELNAKCQWETETKNCIVKKDETTKSIDPISYLCKDLKADECPLKKGCAYDLKKCIHFSGCSSYQFKTHAEC